MKRFGFVLVAFFFATYKCAYALTSAEYGLLQETLSLTLTVICIILALAVLQSLRGGVLSRPWGFFIVAFALMAVASLLRLCDLKSILFTEYDLRPALLVTRTAGMLFILMGLIFYKKEL